MKSLLKRGGGRALLVGVVVMVIAGFAYMQPVTNRFGTDCGNLLDPNDRAAEYADTTAELRYHEALNRNESPAPVEGDEQVASCLATRESRSTPIALGAAVGAFFVLVGASMLLRERRSPRDAVASGGFDRG